MATLFITCGLQAAGKTTLAKRLEQERDHYRSKARALGARVVLCVLDPPIDERWERLSLRNVGLPDDSYLPITWAELEATAALFQRPTPEELALFDPL